MTTKNVWKNLSRICTGSSYEISKSICAIPACLPVTSNLFTIWKVPNSRNSKVVSHDVVVVSWSHFISGELCHRANHTFALINFSKYLNRYFITSAQLAKNYETQKQTRF